MANRFKGFTIMSLNGKIFKISNIVPFLKYRFLNLKINYNLKF